MGSCSSCDNVNRDGAAFCDSCGATLRVRHAARERTETDRRRLGAADPRSHRAEAEVKHVTVMFVDVVSSMRLAERLGADAWAQLIEGFYALGVEAVTAVGGTIDKFTGDGLMAIFGAPIALEDHARRACLGALRLHRDLTAFAGAVASRGVTFQVRIGLHSGEAVVGEIGDERTMSYTAIGHAVGVAARMESLAPPGSTAVSATTEQLVRGEFELAPLHAPVTVKGVAGPQQVYELLGESAARTRLDAREARGELSPFVGRQAEIATLRELLRATGDGAGRSVVLVGDAGIGKSRIVREIRADCARLGVGLLETRCVVDRGQTTLAPVRDLLRTALGIRPGDPPAVARARATAVLGPGFAGDLPLVWEFVGVGDPDRPAPVIDPEARERRLLDVVCRMVLERRDRPPLLVVIEDAHWLDAANGVFVDALARVVVGTNVSLLLTSRPGSDATPPAGSELILEPLPKSAVSELLEGVLGSERAVGDLAGRIAARADGNPFFCEELVQALVDDGHLVGTRGSFAVRGTATAITLPATVQATIAARIDRLSDAEKRVLLVAAVIGDGAGRQLLRRVSGVDDAELETLLERLKSASLLRDTEACTFRHALIREVAYRTQLEERRRRTHASTVDALVALYPERLDEQAAVIAHHAEQADRYEEAAHWHARAATRSGLTSSLEAMRHWQAAKRLADGLPAGPDRDGLAIGARLGILSQSWRLEISGDLADQARTETIAMLGPPQADGPLRVLIDYAYSANLAFGGRVAEGLAVARENTRRAADLEDRSLIVLTAGAHWYGALTCGYMREGLDVAETALRAADGDTSIGQILSGAIDHPYALCLYGRGYCSGFLGNVEPAMRDIRDAIQLAQTEGAGEVEPYALSGLAFLQAMTGDGAGAQDDADVALEVAERRGNGMALMAAWLAHVWAGLATGAHDAAERAADEMFRVGAASRIGVELLTFAHGARSEVALVRGNVEQAVAEATRSIHAATVPAPTWGQLLGRLRLAHALLCRGAPSDVEEARRQVQQAYDIAERTDIAICNLRLRAARDAVDRAAAASDLPAPGSP